MMGTSIKCKALLRSHDSLSPEPDFAEPFALMLASIVAHLKKARGAGGRVFTAFFLSVLGQYFGYLGLPLMQRVETAVTRAFEAGRGEPGSSRWNT